MADEYTGYESAFIPTPQGDVNQDESPQQQQNTQSNGTGGRYSDALAKARPNPLAKYSSYTYQLSLYMITPDAYDVFVRNGRKNIDIVNQAGSGCGGGAYLIAQSGGINNEVTNRAPGFHYDFGIDNLVIKSAVSPNSTQAPTTNVELSFTIYEQYGFSFINNLKRAKDSMDLYSTTVNIKDSTNASRQFFVLGIKFLGYDASGNVINNTNPADTFERYYDIIFNKVDFKIDGRATQYQIEAACIPPQIAMGQKRGVIDKGANQLKGTTVQQLCDALCAKLNKDQTDQVPADREFPNTYRVTFQGDAADIAQSTIVSDADMSKIKWPMAVTKGPQDVNPSLSVKSQPNNQERIVAFNRDTPIIQALTSIINQSDYLIKGLKAVYNNDPQPEKGSLEPIDSSKRAKWFNISTVVSNARFDRKLKDFSFDIEYQVNTYETPVVLSTSADNVAPYYGPFKRYEYWLTGQNSEVIKYEQNMKNSYFTVAIGTMDSGTGNNSQATGGNANVPVTLGKRTNVQRLGKLDVGMEAQNNYVTSLVDPGAYAEASIQILGDPDLLANDMPTGNPEFDSNPQPFYGPDGYSLDARRGQCFIEVDFKEAVDYNNGTGILRVNDKILFWEYPPEIQKKIKGICYLMTKITSTFRGGRFTQDIACTIATFGDATPYSQTEQGREEARQEDYNDNELARLKKRGTPPTGLVEDKPPGDTNGGDPCAPAATPQPSSQETTNQGVADDDANPTAGIPVDVNGVPIGGGLPGA